MSFGTLARRVRDERLPGGARYTALRSAVERYCPLGFGSTWSYVVGHDPIRDERMDTLVRALDVLETSRQAWLDEITAYADRRKAEKRLGFLPRRDEWRYRFGYRWPGPAGHDASAVTVATLWTEHSRHRVPSGLPGDRSMWSRLVESATDCVESYLSSPDAPDVEDPYTLRVCAADLRRLRLWELTDVAGAYDYFGRLTKLVELVAHDVLPLIRRGGVGDLVDPRHDIWVAESNGRVIGIVNRPEQ